MKHIGLLLANTAMRLLTMSCNDLQWRRGWQGVSESIALPLNFSRSENPLLVGKFSPENTKKLWAKNLTFWGNFKAKLEFWAPIISCRKNAAVWGKTATPSPPPANLCNPTPQLLSTTSSTCLIASSIFAWARFRIRSLNDSSSSLNASIYCFSAILILARQPTTSIRRRRFHTDTGAHQGRDTWADTPQNGNFYWANPPKNH